VVGERWAVRQPEFPAYFAYLLAHEFGHATTILTRLWLAIYEDMILRYVPRVAKGQAWTWSDFPHEVRYDRFGMAIAEAIYGRERVVEDFDRILTAGLSEDAPRLVKALALEPSTDLGPLPKELATFSIPFRAELLERWQEDILTKKLKLGACLSDLGYLWARDE